MIRLDRLSKYYSQAGIVSTGLSKVSLELEIGEFVAITGESGSGKSTLLNVISGIDTYEEGEMYVDGYPTSGFSVEDLEAYRKKYIANIFQAFNLINSYTVYQNVELILLTAGYGKDEIADKVKGIIERVGLGEYMNTKASKLSGGQKQRVAIARALAKDTPVIVADEPTGNLDSVSAADIIKLLSDISKDKLIVIVTHNYEQVEEYVTRKITMSDGAVVEDKVLKMGNESEKIAAAAHDGSFTRGSLVRLGTRNAFNIPSKFILLLIVFVFLCAGTIMEYSSSLNSQAESVSGWNNYFDTSRDRVIVTRDDRGEFTSKDYKGIKKLPNVKEIIKDDITIDMAMGIEGRDEYLSVKNGRYAIFKERLEEGSLPSGPDEAAIFVPKGSYAQDIVGNLMDMDKIKLNDDRQGELLSSNLKITGYGYLTSEEQESLYEGNYAEAVIIMGEKGQSKMRQQIMKNYCSQEYEFADNIIDGYSYSLKPNSKVPEGKVYIPEELSYYSEYSAVGKPFKITNKSIYFQDKYKLEVGAVYNENTYEYYTGRKYKADSGIDIFMNSSDYRKMFQKGSYQISVIVEDDKLIDTTVAALNDAGYSTFRTRDGIVSFSEAFDKVQRLIDIGVLVIVLLVLFFISYFIIRLVMKSRNTYFSTVRMLGASKSDCRNLIEIELFTVFTIAFAMCSSLVLTIRNRLIDAGEYLYQLTSYLDNTDLVILYIVLALISILLGRRYSRQLFKKSAMNTFKEEV